MIDPKIYNRLKNITSPSWRDLVLIHRKLPYDINFHQDHFTLRYKSSLFLLEACIFTWHITVLLVSTLITHHGSNHRSLSLYFFGMLHIWSSQRDITDRVSSLGRKLRKWTSRRNIADWLNRALHAVIYPISRQTSWRRQPRLPWQTKLAISRRYVSSISHLTPMIIT